MRPPGDAALGGAAEQAAQQLEQEPESQQPARPDRVQEQEAERDDHVHPGVREQDLVGAEYARDRPAGTDHRDLGRRIGQRLGHGGGNAAQQVEHQEAAMPQVVLDIVPEHPKVEHVAGQVHQPAMQEHRREHGRRGG
jgi:hypothetical protein